MQRSAKKEKLVRETLQSRFAGSQPVLMDKSDYFTSMFSGRFFEVNATAIDLSNCMHELDELNTVLDYMYSGNITLSDKNISYVLSLASLFLLGKLKAACAEFLMANLVPSTAIPILVLAEKFFLQKVMAGCLEVIKAWFPFYICTLKEVAALTQPKTYSRSVQPSGDEREEMLFTVVMPHGTYYRHCFDGCSNMRGIEVLAFSPKRKAWKSVLRHTFTKDIYKSTRHPDKVQDLIGVNETTAFFRFEHKAVEPKGDKESNDKDMTYVVAVNLESKTESVINIPDALIQSNTSQDCFIWESRQNYFIWEGCLCAFYAEDHKWWYLYFNDHRNKCKSTCNGNCWEKICLLSKLSMHNSGRLVTKAFGKDLYVGLDGLEIKNAYGTTGSLGSEEYWQRVHVFCISLNHQAGEKCQVTELLSPGSYKKWRCPFPFEKDIDPKFFCISYPEISQLFSSSNLKLLHLIMNQRTSFIMWTIKCGVKMRLAQLHALRLCHKYWRCPEKFETLTTMLTGNLKFLLKGTSPGVVPLSTQVSGEKRKRSVATCHPRTLSSQLTGIHQDR